MPSWLSRILAALRLLLRSPLYLFLALFLASLLFAVYFWINDLALYRSAAAISTAPAFLWKVFSNQVSTVYRSIGSIDVIAVGAIAALGGVNLALTVLRIRRTKVFVGRAGFASLLGTAGGAFAVSCSACSTALISLLGVAGGLAILPFGGLEISLLALLVLAVSLYYISKSLFEFGITKG